MTSHQSRGNSRALPAVRCRAMGRSFRRERERIFVIHAPGVKEKPATPAQRFLSMRSRPGPSELRNMIGVHDHAQQSVQGRAKASAMRSSLYGPGHERRGVWHLSRRRTHDCELPTSSRLSEKVIGRGCGGDPEPTVSAPHPMSSFYADKCHARTLVDIGRYSPGVHGESMPGTESVGVEGRKGPRTVRTAWMRCPPRPSPRPLALTARSKRMEFRGSRGTNGARHRRLRRTEKNGV